MSDILQCSAFFGVLVSLLSYGMGLLLKKRFNLALFNPLLVSIIVIILILLVFHIDYEIYYTSAKYLSYLLTPATICLAIPMYHQLELLKHHWKAILAGIVSGILTNLGCVLTMSWLFHLSHQEYVTLLPKSITTAIGMGISEQLGGYMTITVAVIIITGILGNMLAETIFKIFHIKHPIAKGIALGTASHAIGTAKAMEMGELEGAMSSLSIVVSGLLTVISASIFAQFL